MFIRIGLRASARRTSCAAWMALAALALPMSGCQNFGDITGSIVSSDQPMPTDDAGLRSYAARWARAYDANPGEKVASINYARALRALTRYSEAESIMRVAAVKAPKDYDVLAAYGEALADGGDLAQAKDVLSRAYPLERPSWRVLSDQGTVEDRLGNYDAAQTFYRDALKIAPGEPSVLANLGLSYALTKQLALADDALREAAASPRSDARVRQNFALVLSLEGKFKEAEQVSERDMSPAEAARNVDSIKAMIAQNDTWKALQSAAPKGARRGAAPPLPGPTPVNGVDPG